MKFASVTKSALENGMTNMLKMIDSLLDTVLSSDPSVQNTLNPMIEIERYGEEFLNYLGVCKNLSCSTEIRETAVELAKNVSQQLIEKMMNPKLYTKLLELEKDGGVKSVDNDLMRSRYTRALNTMLRNLRRCGLDKSDNEIEKLKLIKKKISENAIQFGATINADDTKFVMPRSSLKGLPDVWFTSKRLVDKKSDEQNSTYLVTMKYPDVYPIFESCEVRVTREKIYKSFCARCAKENTPLLEQTVVLKDEMARKLGYANYADFKTEDKVVHCAKNATEFLDTLNTMFEKSYAKELHELTKFAKEHGFEADELEQWDLGFYSRIYKETKFNYDREELRKKFPVKKVVSGLLDIYQKLMGFKFEKVDSTDLFHETVEVYDVYDATDRDALMGRFYLDLYPRNGKFSHACVSPLTLPHIDTKTGEKTLPSGMLICNFGDNYLYFNEVETMFHEFGHMMHLISVKPEESRFSMFSSFGCEWDFIETPSKMFEFWCYEKEPLTMMSDGLTDEEIEKLRAMRNVLPALHYKKQLFFSIFDMTLHSRNYETVEDVKSVDLWVSVQNDVLHHPNPHTVRIGTFDHIMGGYDAGYYGYLRAETYAANLFYTLFKLPNRVMNQQQGVWFRKVFLGRGAILDATDLMRYTLGGEPDDSYFLKSLSSE